VNSDVPTFLSDGWSAADRAWMQKALALASRAGAAGEVPVGAVLVIDGAVAGEGWNRPIQTNDPTAHAEIEAIRMAGGALRNYRLAGSTLYVTLEPCAMCAGALVNARVERLVFAARDIRFGAVRSMFRVADSELLNHRVRVEEGLLGAEAAAMLRLFFETRR
jgi:tRNA(adenine34) deaminase